jgi:hypothetical protein
MSPSSTCLDIGSGYGKSSIVMGLVSRAAVSGIEMSEDRRAVSKKVCSSCAPPSAYLSHCPPSRCFCCMLQVLESLSSSLVPELSFVAGHINFQLADVTDIHARELSRFTHIFSYDAVFSVDTLRCIASALNESKNLKVFMTFHKLQTWTSAAVGLLPDVGDCSFVQICRVKARGAWSREGFSCYVLCRIPRYL